MLNVNIKDSDWPKGAKYVTQDKSGHIDFWEVEPTKGNDEHWICSKKDGKGSAATLRGESNDEWKTAIMKRTETTSTEKHSHYFKDVSNLQKIDVYRVLDLYEVTDPCIQHAVKKLLVAGKRGAKDQDKDIQEAIDTLARWKDMQGENNG